MVQYAQGYRGRLCEAREVGQSAGSCRNAAKVVAKVQESGNESSEVQESGRAECRKVQNLG